MINYQEKVLNFLDVETTGGNSRVDKIIEIYISKVKDNQVIKTFHTFVNPGFKPSPFIQKLTKITYKELDSAPPFEDIAQDLYDFLSDGIFVAHNARFDYSFIKQELKTYGFEVNWDYCCTVKLSRNLYPLHRSHNLDSIATRISFPSGNRHRADFDTEITRSFFYHALNQHGYEKFNTAFNNSIKQSAIPNELVKFNSKEVPENPGVYIFYDAQDYPIYVGMSKNLRRRINEHFYQDLTNSKDLNINQKLKRIETIETAGVIGALIREAILVKKYQPLYNRQLRRTTNLVKLEQFIDEHGYINLRFNNDNNFNIEGLGNLVGVFRSKEELKNKIEQLAKDFGLCSKLLGLEKTKNACFAYQLEVCKGACIHKISADEYNQIFNAAFSNIRIANWPTESELRIKEENGTLTEELIFNKWGLVGTTLDDLIIKEFTQNFRFDLNIYKILSGYLKRGGENFNVELSD